MNVRLLKIDRSDLLALGLLTGTFLAWAFLLVKKYFTFGYFDWDFAFFHQATWNILHGSSYSSLFDTNFFGNHSNLIVFFCLPLYALVQHPLTLVFLKLISYIFAAYILYKLGKESIGTTGAAILMAVYLAYPPNIFGLIYEFDFESLSPAFLFLLFYFYSKKYWKAFLGTALLTILVKENMPLIIITFGIYALFSRGRSKWLWGVVPFILGMISFYFLTYIFIPHFTQSNIYPYAGHYQQFGQSPFGIILSLIMNPLQMKRHLFTPVNLKFLFDLLSPIIFLPCLSPHILFLGLPILLQHLLSSSGTEHVIYYQYGLSLAPFFFLGALKTLSFLRYRVKAFFYLFVLSLMLMTTFLSLQDNRLNMVRRLNIHQSAQNRLYWQMVKAIPKDAAVMATFNFLPELSSRRELYSFHKTFFYLYQDKKNPFITPDHVSYAMIDFDEPWLNYGFYVSPQETAEKIRKSFFNREWKVKQAVEEVVLFSKEEGEILVSVTQPKEKNEAIEPKLSIDDKFNLVDFKLQKSKINHGSLLPIKFQWQSLQEIKEPYEMVLRITKGEEVIAERRRDIGYKVYPTLLWKQGELISETYWLFIPDLAKGEYSLEVAFVNLSQNSVAHLSSSTPDLIKKQQTFYLEGFSVL